MSLRQRRQAGPSKATVRQQQRDQGAVTAVPPVDEFEDEQLEDEWRSLGLVGDSTSSRVGKQQDEKEAEYEEEEDDVDENAPVLASHHKKVSAPPCSQPRPLSPRARSRLEYLREKARRAEEEEKKAEKEASRARQLGIRLPAESPPPVQMIKYVIQQGDDLTDLAVRYGTTVRSILSSNPRITFEHTLLPWVGESIAIPATRFGPSDEMDDSEEKRKEQRKIIAEFMMQTGAEEAEAHFYLDECEWDVRDAVQSYLTDEAWERDTKRQQAQQAQLDETISREVTSRKRHAKHVSARSSGELEAEMVILPSVHVRRPRPYAST